MTELQFRILLIVYLTIIGIGFLAERFVPLYGNAPRHDIVGDYLKTCSHSRVFIFVSFVIILVSATITGLVGMFAFWSPAPTIFAVAVISKHFMSPVFIPVHNVKSEWEGLCTSIEQTLDGFIIALTLFGPARAFFTHDTVA